MASAARDSDDFFPGGLVPSRRRDPGGHTYARSPLPVTAAQTLLLVLVAGLTPQVDEPGAAGRVTDLGNLLTPAQEQSLDDLLESFTQGRAAELAILTVSSLEGQSIEVTPRRVAREWRVGSGDHRNTALLVVARDERLMRWMVGLALQSRLTDPICGRILREVVAPELDRERYYEGLRAGVEAANAALAGDLGALEDNPRRGGARASILGTVLFLAFAVAAALRLGRRGRTGEAAALPLVQSTGVGREVGHRTEGGGGPFRRFGGGGGFAGGGATGAWR